ncbi:hypothetical protein ACFE04_025614 [Oxalis oulophora]
MSIIVIVLLGLGFFISVAGEEVSSNCLTAYREGGAPAALRSPYCPSLIPDHRRTFTGGNCQLAMRQGWRKYQEDRILCSHDIRIPFPADKAGIKEVEVGIMAVFDGHGGTEASEMASNHLLDYFTLHTYVLLDSFQNSRVSIPYNSERERFKFTMPDNSDDSFCLEILKEALEAYRNKLYAGSTATVVLLADGQILVANIGDSKALLCSEKSPSPAEAEVTLLRLQREHTSNGPENNEMTRDIHLAVKQLTSDHHPDRDDERMRVEAFGGFVQNWGGVPRVNGELAVSRAIGDIYYKRFGVISTPEVTGWYPLSRNDTFLVVASDGLFERMSSQNVCDVLWDARYHDQTLDTAGLSSARSSHSFAERLVDIGLEKGSTDNISVVVVPLDSTNFSANRRGICIHEGDEQCLTRMGKNITFQRLP